jgi:DNA polymerase/3'-5' exonuclease PolX
LTVCCARASRKSRVSFTGHFCTEKNRHALSTLHRAATLIESAREQLGRLKLDIKRVIAAGDFRRGCELVSDLALVAETSRLEGEPRKLVSNSQLSIFVTDRRRAGATLLFATAQKST